jgi:hypothetical protein
VTHAVARISIKMDQYIFQANILFFIQPELHVPFFLKSHSSTAHAELLKAEVLVLFSSACAVVNLQLFVSLYRVIKTCYK